MKQLLMKLAARALHTARPPARIAPERVRRILILRLDHVGDFVLTLPAVRGLKESFPDARIDMLITPTAASLCRECPWVDRTLIFIPSVINKDRSASRAATAFNWLQIAGRIASERYDIVIDPRGEVNSRLLARFSGAPLRIGTALGLVENPARERMTAVMTHLISREGPETHIIDHNLAIASAATALAGLPPISYKPAFWELPGQADRVAGKLAGCGVGLTFAVIQAGSNQRARRWGADRWAKVADRLIEKCDFDVVLNGSELEREQMESIKQQSEHPEKVFNLAGEFSLNDLFSLFRLARLMVSVDTGPMHIAAMSGVRCVVLMLPYFAAPHHPYGQRERVLVAPLDMDFWEYGEKAKEEGFEPLLGISVDQVIEAIDKGLC